ncbi:MAG UNVERIFIED_CONTAM: hypothetical protein LVR29_03800 [Microcystis novacekii LVE1205-3]
MRGIFYNLQGKQDLALADITKVIEINSYYINAYVMLLSYLQITEKIGLSSVPTIRK